MADLFEDVLNLPDPDAERRYARLVGVDDVKSRIEKEAAILLDPRLLETWSKKHHGAMISAAESLRGRPPLFVFGGDVGTGKTTLAENFGDAVARDHGTTIHVYRLSLQARGGGAVGEMTKLISAAFDQVRAEARKTKGAGHILVIDEADALAQSRDLDQMHHEDRAGVNALIRGIDQITQEGLRILIVMCTNRLEALDPAVRRRAAAEFLFVRPNEAQRVAVLRALLADAGVPEYDLQSLAAATGDCGTGYGYTYSDLVNRVVPSAVLLAYPDRRVTADVVSEAIKANPATRPFGNDS